MRAILGEHDFVLITLDTLRYDVAVELWRRGRTPNLASLLPASGWEKRHAPGSFTYSSHAAMFAGFLPTPSSPGKHPRRFALRFPGAETIGPETTLFDAPDIVSGFRAANYRTICIGGVGFFNKESALGSVFPKLFEESFWDRSLGVTEPRSTENQVRVAIARLLDSENDKRRVFLFLNISALHQPNYFYLDPDGPKVDTLETHGAALEYVDRTLMPLFHALKRRGPAFVILCSDHGTAYGEDGFVGHRIGHPSVWTVPYAELELR